MTSRLHLERCGTQVALDSLLGQSRLFPLRPLANPAGRGFFATRECPLTQESFKGFWGDEVEQLPARGMRILQAKGLRVGKKPMHPLPSSMCLAAVSYGGSGKYDGTSHIIPFKMLPRVKEHVGGGSSSGGGSGSSSSGSGDLRRALYPDEFQVLGQHQWWPVAILGWSDNHLEGLVYMGGALVVVCVYQFMWDHPHGWGITMRPFVPR
jgi:hypothetical protein